MTQPLMVTRASMPAAVPPAQAEALYDAALENTTDYVRAPSEPSAWPGEDWDDPLPLPSPLPRPPSLRLG